MKKIIVADTIYTPFEKIKNGAILIEGEKIKKIFSATDNYKSIKVPKINFKQTIISPGFIEVHCHGGFGIDFAYAKEKEINYLTYKFLSLGITNLCPTIYALPENKLFNQVKLITKFLKINPIFNKIHLEGPYLNPSKCGAINKNYLRNFNKNEVDKIINIAGGKNLIFTLAPELKNNLQAITYLVKNKCIISLGHSEADFKTALLAYQKGARAITHLFNAMPPLHHRNLSLSTFGLFSPKIYCEAIGDLVHLNKYILDLIFKVRNFKNIILISDGMEALGKGEGIFQLGGKKVRVKNHLACLLNGTLAGSVTPQITMLKIISQELKYNLTKLLPLVSYYPAKYLKLNNTGEIKENKIANLTIFDKYFNIVATILKGNIYFKNSFLG